MFCGRCGTKEWSEDAALVTVPVRLMPTRRREVRRQAAAGEFRAAWYPMSPRGTRSPTAAVAGVSSPEERGVDHKNLVLSGNARTTFSVMP